MIDWENSENQWYEKVFGFYSHFYPSEYDGEKEPDAKLKYVQEKNFDGLEFAQFYIFCKDAGSNEFKRASDKIF